MFSILGSTKMSSEEDQMQVVHHAITGVTEIVSAAGSTDGTVTAGTIYQQDESDRPVSVSPTSTNQPMEVVQIIPVSTEGNMGQMTVSGAVAQMIALNSGDGSQGQLYHVIPVSQSAVAQAQAPHMITVSQSNDSQENTHEHTDPDSHTQSTEIIHDLTQAATTLERLPPDGIAAVSLEKLSSDDVATITLMTPPPPQTLPDGCPAWAARLRGVEKIGDSFRGWVENEVELDLLLTYHKQQTQSFWGTRQSPTPGKPSTRLMWKSQYVPFDGIPFVNIGSRAIVQECQFGPRRKGIVAKKIGEQEKNCKQGFKATCPARIYIKKVRKFPQFRVHLREDMDRKALRQAQERAFRSLKESGLEHGGEERQYVQLPTPEAHQFHDEIQDHVLADFSVCNMEASSRLHPRVSSKIRELVASGMNEVYQVRKAVRKFVEKELFGGSDTVPERHNLSYFPTVNDIQNHVHLAQMAIERGELAVTTVTTEVSAPDNSLENAAAQELQSQLWPVACHPPGCGEGDADGPHTQTVTVTLTTNQGREHVVSQVETTMSDGTTLVSDSLTPETAQLLSALNPKIFQTQSEDEMSRKESETGAQVNLDGAKGYDEQIGQSQLLIQDKISGQFCTNQTPHTIPLTVTNDAVGQTLPSHFLTNSSTVTTEATNLLPTGETVTNIADIGDVVKVENQQQTSAQDNP
ncbi:calcium-responsive transcription factor-like isoform X1 [Branchiostoma floridae]|uniref:Calcium-responsive transcription factor-like isoform X1 n=2 Tax=Branchiostoma floridae TaxID=7739 RepID=A0A9J7KK89_BRAFL|nr:calcium-responsive transcription factor-like isoform X1 [Branchiostoma floridae]